MTTADTKLLPAIPTIKRVLGISESAARRLVQDGLIPTIRVGRLLRIDEMQLSEWLAQGGAGGWKRLRPAQAGNPESRAEVAGQ